MEHQQSDFFAGRTLAIATMHGKEAIIGPILQSELGIDYIVPDSFNTDIFGTFSGEIERSNDPLATARLKCKAAADVTGCDIAIASEGSFGPHPSMVFVPCDDEILVFIDFKNNLEIKVRKISTETNFNGDLFHDWPSAKKFADASLFPSHSLIIRKNKDNSEDTIKGIASWEELKSHFEGHITKYGSAFLETDMRAMCNPTRRKVIEEATHKLLQTIKSTCPDCSKPGYDIKLARPGLPCNDCGAPTASTYSLVYECVHCAHRSEVKYPHGKNTEDPMYCNYCNP